MKTSLVAIENGEARTTSLAIAEGTDNEHASVLLLVRKYLQDLEEFGLVDFKSQRSGGRPTEYAVLNEPQSTLVMTYMRNSEIVRAFKKRLVSEFFRLAQQAAMQKFNVPQTYPEAMRLAADLAEQNTKLVERVAEIEPKAEALNRLALADGTLSLTDAAKTIGVQPQKVFLPRLSAEKWIFRRAGGDHWIAYQDKLQQGLLDHKVTTVSTGDGTERIKEQVRVTPKGLSKLAVLFMANS